MIVYIIMAIIAYCIGSINFSVIFSKKFAGFDVREKGSGNAGSTNMLRSVGKKAAAITLICDVLKNFNNIRKHYKRCKQRTIITNCRCCSSTRTHIPSILPIQRRKRSCNIIRNIINEQLANRINLFSICTSTNDTY